MRSIDALIWVLTSILAGAGIWFAANAVREFCARILDARQGRRMVYDEQWWRKDKCSIGSVLKRCRIVNWDDLRSGEQYIISSLIKEADDDSRLA